MNLDHFQLRDSLRRSIIDNVGMSEAEFDPAVVGWAVYAILLEDRPNPGIVDRLRRILERQRIRWANGAIQGRDLAGLAALSLLERERRPTTAAASDILRAFMQSARVEGRLSPLRIPDQMFLVSLAMKDAPAAERQRMVGILRGQLSGPTHRQILLHAALKELGEPQEGVVLGGEDVADAIASLWWQVRNADERDSVARWEILDAFLSGVDIEETESPPSRGLRALGPWEKALLFECLCTEIRAINPQTLFGLYPLHPRLRKVVRPHFEQGQFPSAVTQAVQVLNEVLQQKTGDSSCGENILVTRYLECKPPKLSLNNTIADPVGTDDHNGVTKMISGVFTGLRNPLSHRPEDSPILIRSPYEAMDQLVLISYLIKRVERAERAS